MAPSLSGRLTAATLSAIALTATVTPHAAQARIPGADQSGVVVITDSTLASVSVGQESGGRVSGSISNRATFSLRCSQPTATGRAPNQVTDARIVVAAMDYYAKNIFAPGGIDAPVVGNIGVGSVYDLIPTGSLSASLGSPTSALVDLRNAQDGAHTRGHTGSIVTGSNSIDFTVGAGQTTSWYADLTYPSTGIRTAFQPGALFFCEGGGNSYVFAGYHGNVVPTDPPPGVGPR
ncbi:hypothetical protein NCCP2495_07880 [Dietzia sp. NCCP-2495]|uniref:hypothetical protein n=1 Tax=Dietzia sp. NCCP-2495 TaxID=2934675 RepID=UPI00223248AF|nr:hypothetical protein [Dietzia sp. NCCP-2495]GLB62910.1 hypothetical protein NCCP2495_07880 [Dietzia sp. NCCP-2495]